MKTQRRAGAIAVCALAAGAAVPSAAMTKICVSNSASDFSAGEARGIAVGIDGSLVLSRSTRRVDGISEASLFAIAAGKDGTEDGAPGDSGRILRISAAGKVDTLATLPERERPALVLGSGRLWSAA